MSAPTKKRARVSKDTAYMLRHILVLLGDMIYISAGGWDAADGARRRIKRLKGLVRP